MTWNVIDCFLFSVKIIEKFPRQNFYEVIIEPSVD